MPKYIIRLDDACQEANWNNWNRIESILDRYDIKPIVAVIPDNNDEKLIYDDKGEQFYWEKVKEWSEKKWSIGLHGYKHLYQNDNSGIINIGNKSEFSGLTLDSQKKKIRSAWKIFIDKGIEPNIWVAPSHSFDKNTLIAIKEETNIYILSDGIALNVFYDLGFFWIPQQLWSIRKMYFGKIWTICLHPNTMTLKNIDTFENKLKVLYKEVIDVSSLDLIKKRRSIIDKIFEKLFYVTLFIKRRIKK